MTPGEKRFLSRRVCYWCEMPLDREQCGSPFEQCAPEVREDRRRRCLETYKPRKPRSAKP